MGCWWATRLPQRRLAGCRRWGRRQGRGPSRAAGPSLTVPGRSLYVSQAAPGECKPRAAASFRLCDGSRAVGTCLSSQPRSQLKRSAPSARTGLHGPATGPARTAAHAGRRQGLPIDRQCSQDNSQQPCRTPTATATWRRGRPPCECAQLVRQHQIVACGAAAVCRSLQQPRSGSLARSNGARGALAVAPAFPSLASWLLLLPAYTKRRRTPPAAAPSAAAAAAAPPLLPPPCPPASLPLSAAALQPPA